MPRHDVDTSVIAFLDLKHSDDWTIVLDAYKAFPTFTYYTRVFQALLAVHEVFKLTRNGTLFFNGELTLSILSC
jgi:hypothetical protein